MSIFQWECLLAGQKDDTVSLFPLIARQCHFSQPDILVFLGFCFYIINQIVLLCLIYVCPLHWCLRLLAFWGNFGRKLYYPHSNELCHNYSFLIVVQEKDWCKLFCKADSSPSHFYVLNHKVIDGTKCRPDDDDICVEGQCRVGGSKIVLLLTNART